MASMVFNAILALLIVYLISYLINTYLLKREGLENYQDYSGNSADDMRILVYKNAGNIAALKDAVEKLIETSTDNSGRLSSLEKEHDALTGVVKETKATADETKANVESAVTDYKAQGDQQTDTLNELTFEEDDTMN